MTLQYTPWIVPLILSATVSAVLGLYALRRRHGREGVLAFALLNLSCAIYSLGEALMCASSDLASQYFWFRLRRPGVDLPPLFLLAFALQYTGWGRWLSTRRLVLLSVVPVAGVLLAWTNEWHHLLWAGAHQTEWSSAAFLVADRGPWWPFLALYQYAVELPALAVIATALVRSPERYRGQMWGLLVAVVSPVAASLLEGLAPPPVDPIPIALAVSGVALAWAIFRHGLLDMIPAARHTIIENMSDAMVVLDQSHRLVDLNPAARRLLGRERTAAIGLPIAEVVPAWAQLLGADADDTELREAEVALDGRAYELRISPVRNKDGAVTGRVVLLHDITEQKQTRESLHRSEETIRAILENIEDGYFEMDLAGTFTNMTDVTARLGGLSSRAEGIGGDLSAITDAESAERLRGTFARVLETGESARDIEYAITARDGVRRWLEASATLMRDAGGTPIGFRGIVRDSTERKRAQEELQEAKRIAEEASRTKGAFLNTVSHELRTPLTSVVGFAKLIKKRLTEVMLPALAGADAKVERASRQVSENVDIIVAEGERLTTLINDVLDLAKIESGKVEWHMQPVAVGEIIARAVAATTSLSGAKGLDVRTEIAELPTVVGDPDRLIQVVINLLSNAIKFTAHGAITCRAAAVDGAIEVRVTDTGAGIAPEDQPKVFEQFVQVGDTLTGKPTGTGLGLPICKQIIEHHGGRIWVESAVGQGSTFAFTLPIEGSAAEDGSPIVPPPRVELGQLVEQLRQRINAIEPTDGAARTVLIVDDDPSIRSLLRQELEASGHQVREARTGEEALAAVKEQRPGLIILDVIMPGLSGFDVAATLRTDPQTLNIPVIILSVVQDRERGLRLGVDQYFTKPVSTEALLHEVDALLARGPSKKKILVVDEDAATVRTLSDALQAQGYSVASASSGPDGIARALADQPDLVLVRSLLAEQHQLVQALRSNKGMEAVSFLLFE